MPLISNSILNDLGMRITAAFFKQGTIIKEPFRKKCASESIQLPFGN
jgi:hypothetical protein